MNSVTESLEQFAYNLFLVGVAPGRIELTLPKEALERLDLEFAARERYNSSPVGHIEQYWTNSGFLFHFKR